MRTTGLERKKRVAARRKKTSRGSGRVAKSALDRMTPEELAAILRTLLANHPNLKGEAEGVATEMISAASADHVAGAVFEAVTSLGIEDLYERAGSDPFGYVEPTEAAWELLEETVGRFLGDMKRRAGLGLGSAAAAICCGIVVGLYRARRHSSDSLLTHAPDFPPEQACFAVAELIRATPASKRKELRAHLRESLPDLVPEWRSMIIPSVGRGGRRT